MTFEDALQVLGIDVHASRKDVRRAYLRLIKVHKPDRDPDGFQRVRAAFELADEEIEWRRAMAAPMISTEPTDFVASAPIVVPADAPSLADLGFESLVDEPASAMVEAPDFESPATDDAWSEPETSVPPVTAADSPARLMRLAFDAIDADEPAEAEEHVLRAFEQATQRMHTPPNFTYEAVHVCLMLYAQRHPRFGRSVSAAFLQWLRDSGAERELMHGWAGIRLMVLYAFLDLPRGLPSTPLSIIAAGMLDESINIEMALYAFAQDKPFASIETREALERYAPSLAEAWAGALRSGEETAEVEPTDLAPPWHARELGSSLETGFTDSSGLGAAILRFFFILLAFAVVRGGCDSGPSPTRVAHQAATRAALREAARPINQLRQPPTASPRTEGAQASAVWRRVFPTAVAPAPTAPQVELSDAPDWLRTFCKTARRGKCQRANGVWAAFRSGDCARAKRRYAWLSNDMMLAPELRTALKRGGRIIQTTCAASP